MNPIYNNQKQTIFILDAGLTKANAQKEVVSECALAVLISLFSSENNSVYLWSFGTDRAVKQITQQQEFKDEIESLFVKEAESESTLIKRGTLASIRKLSDHLKKQNPETVFEIAGLVSEKFNISTVLSGPSLKSYHYAVSPHQLPNIPEIIKKITDKQEETLINFLTTNFRN